ncbi:MAG TPA: MazG nucleotide pyrophosphohydrolase domain-containing protein [Candidatus Babeliales bacterium]|nr:MazG nucleotide pyrophosphohydrolase domain-containing protein [Candidatus Babeliales bacterium]
MVFITLRYFLTLKLGSCKRIFNHNSLRENNNIQKTDHLEQEFGDAIYSLIYIANSFKIDLEKAVDQVLEKYKMRIT